MKKKLIAFMLLSLSLIVTAQTEAKTIKNDAQVLPQTGDLAIGLDILPFFDYIGNMFNSSTDNTLDFGRQNLRLRYYLAPNTAIRFNFLVDRNTKNNFEYVANDATYSENSNSIDLLTDKLTTTQSNIELLVGLQKSRGYGRILGFYGAQIGYEYGRIKEKYSYGNEMSISNPRPRTNDFNTPSTVSRVYERTLEVDHGSTNIIKAGVFAGVEYYFSPKICIGGEINLMYSYTIYGETSTSSERYDGEKVVYEGVKTPKDNQHSFETFSPGAYAGIYLMFHF